jgi:hypothetical protein
MWLAHGRVGSLVASGDSLVFLLACCRISLEVGFTISFLIYFLLLAVRTLLNFFHRLGVEVIHVASLSSSGRRLLLVVVLLFLFLGLLSLAHTR